MPAVNGRCLLAAGWFLLAAVFARETAVNVGTVTYVMEGEYMKRKRTDKRTAKWKGNIQLTLLALPGILYFLIFKYIPLYGLVLPFKDYKIALGFWKSKWCGFQNFEFLFKGKDAMQALKNTLVYNAVDTILGTVVCLVIALALYEVGSRLVRTYQSMLLVPYFLSWVVISMAFKAFLDSDSGLFNHILISLGKEPVSWYTDASKWPVILVLSYIWKGMGYSGIIYYCSLMGINKELFEAAKIDGANKAQCIRYISLPMLRSVVITLFILEMGKVMYGDFGLYYNLPLNSSLLYKTTDVLDTYVYRALLVLGDTGMAAAAGFFQSVAGFFLVILTNWIVKRMDKEQGLF